MSGFPILSLMLAVPLVGAVACLFAEAKAARWIALVTTLVDLALGIVLWANYDVGGAQWQSVRFSGSDIENGRVKTVATNDAARATVSTLLANTHLTVNVAGLGLNATGVTSTVSGALAAAAAPLDDLINGLTDLLGLRLGEADVRVNGVRCGGAALVA